MRGETTNGTDRGQAYTLEGFVGGILLLTAVLFALQAGVVTPTTGGAVDRGLTANMEQEAIDIMIVSQEDAELSELLRYWNTSDGVEYHNTSDTPASHYSPDHFADQDRMNASFGSLLEQRFGERGNNYNVEIYYFNDSNGDIVSDELVYQGSPDANAFTASYTVTLYDEHELTAPGENMTLAEVAEDENLDEPIPNAFDEPIYNVVEVRVVVW